MNDDEGLRNAIRLMKETGVGAVKLEGGKKRAGLSMLPALCC